MLFFISENNFISKPLRNMSSDLIGYKKKKIIYKKSINKKSSYFLGFLYMKIIKNKISFSDGMFLRKDKGYENFIQNKQSTIKKKEKFSHLHNHSDFSLLDGASRISELVLFTKELKIPSISITDHGVMHAVVDLFKECGKLDIKPVAGNEMYVINGNISRNYKKSQLSKYHQIILALSENGYRNLVKLTTLSHLNGWQGNGAFGRPCISKRLLFKYKKDIIITSACLGGEICQNLLDKNFFFAKKVAFWYKNNFEDFFFLELQDHGHREDRAVNMNILKIANESGVRLISTNDSHFTKGKDVEAHDTLLCIQTGKPFGEPGRMRYSGTEFLKSSDEMENMYRDHVPLNEIACSLNSTIIVSNQAENYSIWAEITIPKFQIPDEHLDLSLDQFLDFLGFKGLSKILYDKFVDKMDVLKTENKEDVKIFKLKYKKYYDRLGYELHSIKKMGYSTYFLVVWDFIDFARRNDVPIGSGRGSVAGSLLAFTLGITNIDPIENGLLFERFLNPARKSMPDIDTDFSIDGRDMVIEYVSMKYGQERVAQIITFNRLTSKAILKDMGRSAKRESNLIEKMSDLIPISRGKPLDLKTMVSRNSPVQDFRQNYLKNANLKNLIDKSLNFEGMNKTTAVHAAGIVISSRNLDNVVPLTRGMKGEVITQYPMEDVEYLGLLKMDFLGLKNLSMIESIVNFVNYRFKSEILTLDSKILQPHFDKSTFNLLTKRDLDGVFQLDASLGMKDIVAEMRPSSIQDISSILALYRPGPLDTGLIPRFIKRKRKVFLYKFDYPELKGTLEETYGILIYQEQIMKVAQELGGFNMSQADILRRAMGKKRVSEMRTQEKNFIQGCLNNSLEKEAGKIIFNQMVGFAEYCFNKSHSTAYAFTTYQTAWLKSHWPLEFFSSLMNVNLTDFEKIEKFIYQASSMGVFVNKPEINSCDVFFVPDYSKQNKSFISFGLGSVKSIGEIAASIIITDRKVFGGYLNLIEIVNRLIEKQLLSKKLIETLIICGCLDKIDGEKERKRILINLDKIIEWMNRVKKIKYLNQPLFLDFASLKKKDIHGEKKKSYNNGTRFSILGTKSEQSYLAAKLTGINNVNSLLFKQLEIVIFLGTAYSLSFRFSEFDNTDLIDFLKPISDKKIPSLFLNRIEKIEMFENFQIIEDFLTIGVILEIQEYQTSFQKKISKIIFEDFNGLTAGLIFQNNDISLSREKNIKTKEDLAKSKSKFFPGDIIIGYGIENEWIFGIRKIKLFWVTPLYDYKIMLVMISTKLFESYSIHLLFKFNSTLNLYFSKCNEKSIPLLINVKGKTKSETLKTGLSLKYSKYHIVSEIFKRLGLECNIFEFNQVLK